MLESVAVLFLQNVVLPLCIVFLILVVALVIGGGAWK